MSMSPPAFRLAALCGLVSGAFIALPALIEAFTGETAATSCLLGLAPALSLPLIAALHRRQSHVTGRAGELAFVVNLVGAGLFAGAVFTLNMALFYLDETVLKELLKGPTRSALLGAAVVFAVGTALFGAATIRSRVWPTAPSWAYTLALPLLALLAPLPDSPITLALHVLAGATLIRLAAAAYGAPAPGGACVPPAGRPTRRPGGLSSGR